MPEKLAPKVNAKLPEEPARAQRPWSVPEPILKNPTLVEFHNKNATMPEWRLQLQNAVRQRKGRLESSGAPEQIQSVGRAPLTTSGANALKADESVSLPQERADNPTLASALQRIEKSRKKFLHQVPVQEKRSRTIATPNKTHLYIAAKSNEILPNPHESPEASAVPREAKTNDTLRFSADAPKQEKAIPQPKPASISTSFALRPTLPFETGPATSETNPETIDTALDNDEASAAASESIEVVKAVEVEPEAEAAEYQEIDDCAPLAMRFNAGLFDLIIGSFASLLVLSPFMALGANWVSLSGAIAFVAVNAVVMFLYLTAAVGYYGRTFGMRLFSLEVVDIEGEEYPTVDQAAISSLVYLAGFAFAGLGFLTILLNDEKRAAHDLLSRTIVVKEF